MARTALTVTTAVRAGVELPAGTAGTADGHKFTNTGNEILIVANGAISARVLTITVPKKVDGLAVASRTVSVPASKTYLVGPFAPGDYNQGTGADAACTYLGFPAGNESDLTVQVVKLA